MVYVIATAERNVSSGSPLVLGLCGEGPGLQGLSVLHLLSPAKPCGGKGTLPDLSTAYPSQPRRPSAPHGRTPYLTDDHQWVRFFVAREKNRKSLWLLVVLLINRVLNRDAGGTAYLGTLKAIPRILFERRADKQIHPHDAVFVS